LAESIGSHIQGGQVDAIAVEGVVEITRTQAGIKLIFAAETCNKIQSIIIVKCCCTILAIVILGSIAAIEITRGPCRTSKDPYPVAIATGFNSPKHKSGLTLQLGGGGELGSLDFTDTGLKAINPAPEHSQFGLKLFHQSLELVGHLGDAIKTGI